MALFRVLVRGLPLAGSNMGGIFLGYWELLGQSFFFGQAPVDEAQQQLEVGTQDFFVIAQFFGAAGLSGQVHPVSPKDVTQAMARRRMVDFITRST